jgi:hypothetical protein
MAKSTKMGVQKLRIQSPEIKKDVRNKKAREVRAFKKEKQMKEDAQPPVVRTVKRPEKKAK